MGRSLDINISIEIEEDEDLFEIGMEFGFFLAFLRQKDLMYVFDYKVREEGDEK